MEPVKAYTRLELEERAWAFETEFKDDGTVVAGVEDVLLDGQSVVGEDKVARLTSPTIPVKDVFAGGRSVVDINGVAIVPAETEPKYTADKPQINARLEVLESRPSTPSNVDDVVVDGTSVVGEDKVARITLPPPGVEEAPADAKIYGRRSGGWEEVKLEGGGILEESDPVAMPAVNALSIRVAALETKPAPAESDPVAMPRVQAVEALIPQEASPTNELADKAFVNSTITYLAANRVTMNAQSEPFPTNAALMSATEFYYQGALYTPTKNDYTNVSSDEAAPDPKYVGGQTRYRFDGVGWVYEMGINEKPFTAAQNAAIDSGITAQTVARMEAFMTGEFGGLVAANAPAGEIYVIAEGPVVPATGVSITPSSFTIDEGLTRQLVATVIPANATSKAVNWSTSNAAVATVNSQGIVTAVAPGTATITATAADGSGVYGTAQATVQQVQPGVILVTGISLNYNTLSLDPAGTQQLNATVSPSNATDSSVNWSSRNPEIATVSQTGLVTAVIAGETVITCAANDASGVTAQCALTVRGAGQNEDKMIAHFDFGRYADGYQGVVEDLSGFNNLLELSGLSEYGEGMNGIINGRMQINRNIQQASDPILSTMNWPIPAVLEDPGTLTFEMVVRMRTRFSAKDRLTSPTTNAISTNPVIVWMYRTVNSQIKACISGAVADARGLARISGNGGWVAAPNTEHDVPIMGYYDAPGGTRLPLSEVMHHVVVVWSRDAAAIYVNGAAVISGGGKIEDYQGQKIAFFPSRSDATRGDIAEVKIYNTALTATKVQSLYAAAKTKYPTIA